VRILVVDDEPEMAEGIRDGLLNEGHAVTTASDGAEGLARFEDDVFDAAILDVTMPGMSGLELTGLLRRAQPELMIILLTARDAVEDRVRGLDAGADDYMVKPFDLAELAARLRAIVRRGSPQALQLGSVALDMVRHRARVDGRDMSLSRTEFDLLRLLMSGAGTPISRQQILAEVWDGTLHVDPNVVDQYLRYLRRKLADHDTGIRVVTQRGVGFSLVVDG
jgi:DNA-binding response OmpR family regulator